MLLDSQSHVFTKADIKFACTVLQRINAIDFRHLGKGNWLRGRDLNPRPSGYEPDELPGCSTPRLYLCQLKRRKQIEKVELNLSTSPDDETSEDRIVGHISTLHGKVERKPNQSPVVVAGNRRYIE